MLQGGFSHSTEKRTNTPVPLVYCPGGNLMLYYGQSMGGGWVTSGNRVYPFFSFSFSFSFSQVQRAGAERGDSTGPLHVSGPLSDEEGALCNVAERWTRSLAAPPGGRLPEFSSQVLSVCAHCAPVGNVRILTIIQGGVTIGVMGSIPSA